MCCACSVRINERKQKSTTENKKMAYLVDLHTISVIDLMSGMVLSNVTHDSKINWLEVRT